MPERLSRCFLATSIALLLAAPGAARAADLWPSGADVRVLTEDGSAVGPFERLRVEDKYTVFDVFAAWCTPCRLVDRRLHQIVAERSDVAVRKLDVVSFDSPLAKELGEGFDGLPFVVVFTPRGHRIEISGADLDALDDALAARP